MSILVLQSSWWGRESWLLCLICLPGVLWRSRGSSSPCHGVVCSLWLWYFLIILTNFGRNDPYTTLFKIVQIVTVHCISRSHELKIDFQDENLKHLLVWNHKALSFDIWYVASPSGLVFPLGPFSMALRHALFLERHALFLCAMPFFWPIVAFFLYKNGPFS